MHKLRNESVPLAISKLLCVFCTVKAKTANRNIKLRTLRSFHNYCHFCIAKSKIGYFRTYVTAKIVSSRKIAQDAHEIKHLFSKVHNLHDKSNVPNP